MEKIKSIIKLLRPKHSVKNLLIFLPLIFGLKDLTLKDFRTSILGFVVFCLVASSIYIINDYKDIEKDRLHPVKKKRPLASGAVTKKEAWITLSILLLIAIIISFTFPLASIGLIAGYFVLNLGYSLGLKNIPILDVVILTSGFMIRLFLGSSLSGIAVSPLLYLVVMSGAFYLGISKRYNEIIKTGNQTRSVLKKYNVEYLKSIMNMFLVLIIVFYTEWCSNAYPGHRDLFLASVPMLIILIISYIYVAEKDKYGDPADVIMKNKPLMLIGLLFIMYLMVIIRL